MLQLCIVAKLFGCHSNMIFIKAFPKTMQLIFYIVDMSGQTDVIFDFSRTFDRISHSKLVQKLTLLGCLLVL